MLLHLLRHADAVLPREIDGDRFLSDKGLKQARRVARFCEAHHLEFSLILSSPVRRAEETAQAVAKQLRVEMITAPWLACGMDPQTGLGELEAFRDRPSLLLVGHEPDFSRFAAHLLGLGDGDQIRIRKASLTGIDLDSGRAGAGKLQFSIPCRLM
ncbi:MAG: phosphohistidine phosphatase SixA [Verrucomicrobiota bacterium]|nr:phosphohistidine phosphatase SixA [Verrucomicrobiota bacterium]